MCIHMYIYTYICNIIEEKKAMNLKGSVEGSIWVEEKKRRNHAFLFYL